VKDCTGIKADSAVAVDWYDDGATGGGQVSSTAAAPPGQLTLLVASHFREIGVGALAAFSLFMAMMMVRKGAAAPLPVPEIDSARDKPTQHLNPDTQLAGEVAEGDRMMDGMELDDEAVKTQQVIEQVSDMVTENPDAAANLVKRWLNRV
jgi:flagellar biosynthesis/type III secretory pathway M-ring protein FliF/YscJ